MKNYNNHQPVFNRNVLSAAIIIAMFATDAALSQTRDPEVEEIVVTGSFIRSSAPVGSNLISIDRDEIDRTSVQTTQEILKNVPALTGFGSDSQGQNRSSYYMPTIHNLGASSSNSTLVLIDGHRFSPGGQQQTLVDAGIVPPIAIQRVEVLAEGASSAYGSDAVAGVVNFITRDSYDGVLVTGQKGFASGGYERENLGLLTGLEWDTGSALLAYNYSNRSNLAATKRDWIRADQRDKGGSNFQSFNCAPASLQPGGSGPIYLSHTDSVGVANNSSNAPCDLSVHGDLYPDETRHNVMVKLSQSLSERLSGSLTGVYSNREVVRNVSRGTLTATAFRDGDQANPFYMNPPEIDSSSTAATHQTIRWDANELLGPGAESYDNAVNYYVAGELEYFINDNFRVTGLGVYGREDNFVGSSGVLNGSSALLALNGTTNGGGSLTQPSVPSTGLTVHGFPLTPDNALDVWNPAASNRTSDHVLQRLIDNDNQSRWYYSIKQARVSLDGTLFEIPTGEVKVAIGGEYAFYDLDINRLRANNTGPMSSGSEFFNLYLERNVKSAFAEILIPVVSDAHNIPFMRSFDINLSGRYDKYSDTGSTTNPRAAFAWDVTNGLRFRGNYSESFVAPQLTSYGDRSRGGLTSFSGYSATSGTIIVPLDNFPAAAQLPGCTTPGQQTCTITSSTPGISVNGSPANPEPGRGKGWSLGLDFSPEWAPGLRGQFSLFNTRLINQITGTSVSNAINSEALNSNLQIFPQGATAEDIESVVGNFPQNSTLPPTIYYILSVRQQNVLNLEIEGVDGQLSYRIDTNSLGAFTVGGAFTRFHKFDQHIAGGPIFSVLNTTGFNNTFPSIALQGRASLMWDYGNVSASLFANHIGSYKNWSSNSIAPVTSERGNPTGGGDRVASSTRFDLNMSYNIASGRLEGSQLFLDVTNLFDRNPPFYNTATGYDSYSGNILGRLMSVGFRASF